MSNSIVVSALNFNTKVPVFGSTLHLYNIYILTSRPLINETVLGGFDFSKIIAGGPKNKLLDGLYAKFIAKSIGKNRNPLAFVAWEIFVKN